MTLAEITNDIKKKSEGAAAIGSTFKFQFDDNDVVFVDGTQEPPVVSNEDRDADCTMIMSYSTYEKLMSGKLNPTMALMMGKVKIKGDMGVAMKLQSYL